MPLFSTSPITRLLPLRAYLSLYLLFFAILLISGCHNVHQPATQPSTLAGLSPLTPWPSVHAMVDPPIGWTPDPLKSSSSHTHQVWISPSGHTAYGVIHFSLPLPVSANFILPFYLRAWRKDQGECTLLQKADDPLLPGIRFTAEGGRYKTWSNLITSGFDGWSIYVGVVRGQPINQDELALATAAREHTRIGLQ